MKITVKRITRGFEKRVTFSAAGGMMVTATAPAWVTVEVAYDPDKEKAQDVAKKASQGALKLAKEFVLADMEQEWGEGARNKVEIPQAVGKGKYD